MAQTSDKTDSSATPKHKLSPWDCKKSTFQAFSKDNHTLVTEAKLAYITSVAKALFLFIQTKADEAKKAGQNFKEDLDQWTTQDEIDTLSNMLNTREAGRLISRLEVVQTSVYRETFGSNFTKFKESGYDTQAKFDIAKEIAWEDYLLTKDKFLLSRWQEATFPKKGRSADGEITDFKKHYVRSVLFDPSITELLDKGETPGNIHLWRDQPWKIYSVKVWLKILQKYEGINESMDTTFWSEFSKTAASGLGPRRVDINEVDRRMKLQLEVAQKAFTSVEMMCNHLRICTLMTIIEDMAKAKGPLGDAWKLGYNFLVASLKVNTPISTTVMEHAIGLAQKHLERIPGEELQVATLKTAAENIDDETENEDADDPAYMEALQATIAKKQRTLSILQSKTQPQAATVPRGGRGGSGGFRGRGGGGRGSGTGTATGRPPLKLCSSCGRYHPGDPPEDNCFKRDVAAERKKLDALEEVQRKGAERAKDRKEQELNKKTVAFANELSKPSKDYAASVSLEPWSPTLVLAAHHYKPTSLDVRQALGPAIDSASPISIQDELRHARLTRGPNVHLEGIQHGSVSVPEAECSFPTVDDLGNPVLLKVQGKGIYFKDSTSKVIALQSLLLAGCRVNFEVGRAYDHQYGGTIVTPDGGTTINMTYAKGIWRLPVLTPASASARHQAALMSTTKVGASGILADTPYRVLLDTAKQAEHVRAPSDSGIMEGVMGIDEKLMQVVHDKWGHPSNTKMERIVRYYKSKGFPTGFLKQLKNFKCKTCALCKGARVYKHTKRVQEKMTKGKENKKKMVEQVLLETETTNAEDTDDLLKGFQGDELHLDYGHSIALGYHNER
jgi:hypothetical protein